MSDKFASMAAFVTTVEENGFSAAARKKDVATSSITRLVDNLELSLGTTLLNRSTRKLTLTAAGEVFYQQAKLILNQLSIAEENIRDLDSEPRGQIKLAMPMALGRLKVMPIVNQFMKTFPAIHVDAHLSDDDINIQANDIDIAIRIGELPSITTLIATKISPHARCLVASPNYLIKHGKPSHPNDLTQHQCMLFGYNDGGKSWNFMPKNSGDITDMVTISPTSILKVNNSEVLLDAVKSDLGIALLPDWLAKSSIESGEVLSLLTNYDANPHGKDVNIYALFPENRRTMKKVRLFIDYLKESF
jgi:DNA-binding transcriptional LysR family regulator